VAGRDRREDAAFDRLLGNFAAAPVADGPVGAVREFAGEGDQLAELFRREVGGSPRTGGIRQPRRDRSGNVGVCQWGGQPAGAPASGHLGVDAEVASNLGVVEAVGGGQDDAPP
jgi:hypothetical protein